jgi:flagellar biosynthesis regulator FlbT
MSLLHIELKPGEKCIVGGAVISNPKFVRIKIAVENAANISVLRGDMVMTAEKVDTLCKNLYFTIQLMYIDSENKAVHKKAYKSQLAAIEKAVPSFKDEIERLKEHIRDGLYYKALLKAADLIKAESLLIAPLAHESNDLQEQLQGKN